MGERKAVTSDRFRLEGERAASQEALIPQPGKTAAGEPNGETSSTFDRDAQSRACRRWARLGIGSLGTICFVA